MSDDLQRLTPEELGRLFPIEIAEPDDSWPDQFQAEKAKLERILGPLAKRIEHIGSTAVPGLAAKPTIDILIEIPGGARTAERIKDVMQAAGYLHMREQHEHLMFVRGYTRQGLAPRSFHVHMARKGQHKFWERVLFRDYLIEHPEIAAAYAALKYKLAVKFRYDRDGYTEAKTEFIVRFTALAVEEEQA
ncbi:MAG: GrpB family protein [Anaerolineales bacterium]